MLPCALFCLFPINLGHCYCFLHPLPPLQPLESSYAQCYSVLLSCCFPFCHSKKLLFSNLLRYSCWLQAFLLFSQCLHCCVCFQTPNKHVYMSRALRILYSIPAVLPNCTMQVVLKLEELQHPGFPGSALECSFSNTPSPGNCCKGVPFPCKDLLRE